MTTGTRTRTKPAPAAIEALAAGGGPLRHDLGAQILRERTEWAWALGIGEPREPTAAERKKYADRRTDPAFGALIALAEMAAAGEDITALPVTFVDAGPAPELQRAPDPVQAVAEAVAYGLASWPGRAVVVPDPPQQLDPYASDKVYGPKLDAALDRFEAAHDEQDAAEEAAGHTSVMSAVDVHTDLIDAVGDEPA